MSQSDTALAVVLDNIQALRYQLTRAVLEVPIQGEKGKSV